MTIEEIIEILKPLDEITNDEMLFRDYREISKENPDWYKDKNTEYHQLLWFNDPFNTSVNFWLYEDYFQVELRHNDNITIKWVKSNQFLDSQILRYFILGVETHFEYLHKINEFREGVPTKDFIREERLRKVLEK